MSEKVKASDSKDGVVYKTKDGHRFYILRKDGGGARMLSKEDAKRLRAELGAAKARKATGKAKPKPTTKTTPATTTTRKPSTSKKATTTTTKKRRKRYLGDFL